MAKKIKSPVQVPGLLLSVCKAENWILSHTHTHTPPYKHTHIHILRRLVAIESPAFLCIRTGKILQDDMYIHIYLYIYLSNFLILSKSNCIDTPTHIRIWKRRMATEFQHDRCFRWRTEIHFLSIHALRSCHYVVIESVPSE